jgi:hypothetical protein
MNTYRQSVEFCLHYGHYSGRRGSVGMRDTILKLTTFTASYVLSIALSTKAKPGGCVRLSRCNGDAVVLRYMHCRARSMVSGSSASPSSIRF